MQEEVQVLKRAKYEYDQNDGAAFGLNDRKLKRSGKTTEPNKTLQDHEVAVEMPLVHKPEGDISAPTRDRALFSSPGRSEGLQSDDPEILDAAKTLLLLRAQWKENKPKAKDTLYETIENLRTRLGKKKKTRPRAPIINPNMRRSFEGTQHSSKDPEQVAQRKRNSEASSYSRYQSGLRKIQLDKDLDEAVRKSSNAKQEVANKRVYLRGLLSHIGNETVDFKSPDGLRDAKRAVDRQCLELGKTPPQTD